MANQQTLAVIYEEVTKIMDQRKKNTSILSSQAIRGRRIVEGRSEDIYSFFPASLYLPKGSIINCVTWSSTSDGTANMVQRLKIIINGSSEIMAERRGDECLSIIKCGYDVGERMVTFQMETLVNGRVVGSMVESMVMVQIVF